jgi:hypothetical protein
VKTVLRAPGVNFVGPHVVTIDGAAAAVRVPGGHVGRLVGHSGVWRVYRLISPRLPARCVGA